MLLKDTKKWRIKQIDELDDGELGKQKYTQKRDSARTDKKVTNWANLRTKQWRIIQILHFCEITGKEWL